MATMTVVVVNEPGGLEKIRIEERDIPQPGPGQILVKVGYCGCNWADTQMREGIYPHKTDYPLILGAGDRWRSNRTLVRTSATQSVGSG